MLSLLPWPGPRIMLCRRVRSSTFFSVNGKYSARCVVMSSLGGRCPKKLRSLPFLLGLFDDGLSCVFCTDDDDEAAGASGICTPRPLRMLTELARLNAFVPGTGATWSAGGRRLSLTVSVLLDAFGNAVRYGLVGLGFERLLRSS